jgi:hypothetical protein
MYCLFYNMVKLLSCFVSTDFGACSYQCPLLNFTPNSLRMIKSVERTPCLVLLYNYCPFASIVHADIM